MKYLHWHLDNSLPIEAEDPLGTFAITGDSGAIEEKDVFLDSFFRALILGLSDLMKQGSASVDLIDEPHSLILENSTVGIKLQYRGQAVEIYDFARLELELSRSVNEFLGQLDTARNEQGKPILKVPVLRAFSDSANSSKR